MQRQASLSTLQCISAKKKKLEEIKKVQTKELSKTKTESQESLLKNNKSSKKKKDLPTSDSEMSNFDVEKQENYVNEKISKVIYEKIFSDFEY